MDVRASALASQDQLAEIFADARLRRFVRGEAAFHRGDGADCLHLVDDGRFSVAATAANGRDTVVSVLRPGETFGALEFLAPRSERTMTVRALEPARTRVLPCRDLQRVRVVRPELGELLLRMLAQRVVQLSERLADAFLAAEVRVLRRLVDVAATYTAGGGPAIVPLTQQDFAELAGTSRSTVNQVLREAERRGVLRLARGRILVLDPNEVNRLAVEIATRR